MKVERGVFPLLSSIVLNKSSGIEIDVTMYFARFVMFGHSYDIL